jgi:hypothetical protein
MRLEYFAMVVLAAGLAPGCSTSPTSPSHAGTLSIALQDAPLADGVQAVFVTFSEVSVERADGGWTKLSFAGDANARTCDLLRLTTSTDVLGSGSLEAGHYTQLRLLVSNAKLFFDNPSTGPACATNLLEPMGSSADMTIPSKEVKLNREFDVEAGGATLMLLDFDADHSIVQMGPGRYLMNPVIAVVSVQ